MAGYARGELTAHEGMSDRLWAETKAPREARMARILNCILRGLRCSGGGSGDGSASVCIGGKKRSVVEVRNV